MKLRRCNDCGVPLGKRDGGGSGGARRGAEVDGVDGHDGAQRRRRDPALSAPEERQLDGGLLVLLLATALTGLLLLALRAGPAMGVLLVIHLGVVLALFVTLPYGKLVHGLYRAAALIKYRREESTDARHSAAG